MSEFTDALVRSGIDDSAAFLQKPSRKRRLRSAFGERLERKPLQLWVTSTQRKTGARALVQTAGEKLAAKEKRDRLGRAFTYKFKFVTLYFMSQVSANDWMLVTFNARVL
jgi:hypothetical protein